MGYRHSREEILEGALATAFNGGLSQVTYGRVAKRLGISDRVVVYYFPTKDDLITELLLTLAGRLQETLAPAFAAPAPDHLVLARTAWPILASTEADPTFGLFFEANGLAAAARPPYDVAVPLLVEAWLAWTAALLDGTPDERRGEALAAIALLDGLLLLRQVAGPDAARQAAVRLGIESA